ncbi:hypothetical protein NQ318_012355 [Aromia moschata]|uniref:Helix-turn-helix domain-containing protein n=1 Tax=Aromia moschata TaxID=1265417 RepID=A0AAV8XF28_9CUCU|nr:hypothetical protein NQ318_012355 [Aromia moschata]
MGRGRGLIKNCGGKKIFETAEEFCFAKSTVGDILNHYRETGNLDIKCKSSGRPRLVTERSQTLLTPLVKGLGTGSLFEGSTYCIFFTVRNRTPILFFDSVFCVHSNIKFTMETEKDGVLPFLDLPFLDTNNNKLVHGVYRKKTHTDRYLNAASHNHPQQKRSLIKTLVHRAETICDDESRPEELMQIKEALTKNGYKEKGIDRVCRTQRTKIEQQPTKENTVEK